jgi:glycosyltransferase involved in cell wall biosynthesis
MARAIIPERPHRPIRRVVASAAQRPQNRPRTSARTCAPAQVDPHLRISLVITTYNWPEALDLALRSVRAQHRLPDEIVVADDGSAEPTTRLVQSWAPRLGVPVRHVWQENRGFRAARMRNLAIAATRGDYVLLVDGDMVLHPAFVSDHRDAAERGCFVQGSRSDTDAARAAAMLGARDTRFGPLTPGIRKRHMTLRSPLLSALASRKAYTVDRVKTCNQGLWRSDLVAVNGFDERFVGWGPEDKECGARLNHIGVARKYLRFLALATHLDHPRRDPPGTNPNDAILAETLARRATWCELGLDQHLDAFAGGVPAQFRPPWAA